MKYFLIVFLIGCALASSAIANPNGRKLKPSQTHIRYENGLCLLISHGPKRKAAGRIVYQDKLPESAVFNPNNTKFEIFPCPLSNNGKISFELKRTSKVRIYALAASNDIIEYYNGELKEGDQTLDFDFSSLNKGLVNVILEVDGAAFFAKVIKI